MKELCGRQGRGDQQSRRVVLVRWDATHPPNQGGTWNGSVRPDEAVSPVGGRDETIASQRVTSGFDFLGLGVRATRLDDDFHSNFHFLAVQLP